MLCCHAQRISSCHHIQRARRERQGDDGIAIVRVVVRAKAHAARARKRNADDRAVMGLVAMPSDGRAWPVFRHERVNEALRGHAPPRRDALAQIGEKGRQRIDLRPTRAASRRKGARSDRRAGAPCTAETLLHGTADPRTLAAVPSPRWGPESPRGIRDRAATVGRRTGRRWEQHAHHVAAASCAFASSSPHRSKRTRKQPLDFLGALAVTLDRPRRPAGGSRRRTSARTVRAARARAIRVRRAVHRARAFR